MCRSRGGGGKKEGASETLVRFLVAFDGMAFCTDATPAVNFCVARYIQADDVALLVNIKINVRILYRGFKIVTEDVHSILKLLRRIPKLSCGHEIEDRRGGEGEDCDDEGKKRGDQSDYLPHRSLLWRGLMMWRNDRNVNHP